MYQSIKPFIPRRLKSILRRLQQSLPYYKDLRKKAEENNLLHLAKVKVSLDCLRQDGNLKVLSGPFQGMKYIEVSNCSSLLPKITGTYEEPLISHVKSVLSSNYNYIYDVGCAEGYYAVGFKLRSPISNVIAYDNNPEALKNCLDLARLNSLSNNNISFKSNFDSNFFARESNNQSSSGETKHLIFMDVEGAEIELLDPVRNPDVLLCDVIVELHDCFVEGATQKVLSYFQNTHKIQIIIDYSWRKKPSTIDSNLLDAELLEFAMNEFRPKGMSWLVATRVNL